MVVGDEYYLHYFQPDGTFIKRVNASSARYYVSGAKDGTLFSSRHLRDADGNSLQNASFIGHVESRTCFTPEGDLIESHNNKIRIWKRAYRTKGLPVRWRSFACREHHPACRDKYHRFGLRDYRSGRCQCNRGHPRRSGRCLRRHLQMDPPPNLGGWHGFEDRDPHRNQSGPPGILERKPDWPDVTGTLKFEIICHDARTDFPVDLHFLTLPLPDGNLTISRSPLKDSDFESYAKFLVASGATESFVSNGSIIDNGDQVPKSTLYFHNCGARAKMARLGQLNAYLRYQLTRIHRYDKPRFQEWTVPDSGTYSSKLQGQEGRNPNANGDFGYGCICRGKFNLNVNQNLKSLSAFSAKTVLMITIVAGGGGTFVTTRFKSDFDNRWKVAHLIDTRGGNGLDGAIFMVSWVAGINGGAGNSNSSRRWRRLNRMVKWE